MPPRPRREGPGAHQVRRQDVGLLEARKGAAHQQPPDGHPGPPEEFGPPVAEVPVLPRALMVQADMRRQRGRHSGRLIDVITSPRGNDCPSLSSRGVVLMVNPPEHIGKGAGAAGEAKKDREGGGYWRGKTGWAASARTEKWCRTRMLGELSGRPSIPKAPKEILGSSRTGHSELGPPSAKRRTASVQAPGARQQSRQQRTDQQRRQHVRKPV